MWTFIDATDELANWETINSNLSSQLQFFRFSCELTITTIIKIIIIIIVILKITHIKFHHTSRLLPYISVINVNAERLKAKLRAESNINLIQTVQSHLEEFVGKLCTSLSNNNKRYRDRFNVLETEFLYVMPCSASDFSDKCSHRKLKTKTKLTRFS